MATQPISRWNVRDNLQYHVRHQWCRLEGDIVVTGITDYTQDTAGDILYLSLPEIGQRVQENESMGSLESGKWVGQIYAPVSGQVVDRNEHLAENPGLMNKDPYGQGWLVKIRPTADHEPWLNSAQYREILDELGEEA